MNLAASSVSRAFSRDLTAATDRDLVATAVSGVEGSFEELVRRYQRPISAYVYRMVGNYESALDLTQEIFIKVYSSLSRYRAEFKFSTWIYKIAHNAAIDHLRRTATREQSLVVGPKAINSICRLKAAVPVPNRKANAKSDAARLSRWSEPCPPTIVS
jgi:RNA polymerase sigma factor (sigma-70 family)